MKDKLLPLRLPPGFYRNGTLYQTKNRWADGNLVRFFEGTLRPVGGWRRMPDGIGGVLGSLDGVPRAALGYVATGGVRRLVVGSVDGNVLGTVYELFVVQNGTVYDITPTSLTTEGVKDTSSTSGAGEYGDLDYGDGPFGGYGVGLAEGDVWHLDTFGDYVVACRTGDGRIFVWDGNTANRAVPLGTAGFPGVVTGGTAPTNNLGVVVTPERFVVALGADGNARKLKWGDIESFTQWDPTAPGSQAGSFTLTTNGRIRTAARTKKQTLIWTDTDLHSMTYIGPGLVYSFQQEGDNCGIIGPNAAAVAGTRAVWMGVDGFYSYDGYVRSIPCEVHDAVFGDINRVQAQTISCVTNMSYGEVTWFYPSASSDEPNRYVTLNIDEGHWVTGTLSRNCGIDRGPFDYPIWIANDGGGVVYEHEYGTDRGSEQPFIESGVIELGEGDRAYRVQRIVPDENTLGRVRCRLYTAMWPTDAETERGPFTVGAPTNVRFTARQMRLRIEQDVEAADEVDWRIGTFRLGVAETGHR